ncbi:MAG: hypothetical protein FGM40_06600 [Rhodocyclaceae bacterium]|nr:hypothetical protein [Rhodocyclaceae bacterium]
MNALPAVSQRWHAFAVIAGSVLLAACSTPDPLNAVAPLLLTGDTDKAIAQLQAEVDRHPDRSPPRVALMRLRESAAQGQLRRADQALANGDEATAADALERAAQYLPTSPLVTEAKLQFERHQRASAAIGSAQQSLDGGQLEPARNHIAAALALEPGNRPALQLQQRIQRQMDERATAQEPQLRLLDDKPVNLEFRDAPLRQVFEALSRVAGLSFVFDQEVRRDARVNLVLNGVKVSEALKVIAQANRVGFSVLGERALLVYPATAAKRNEYRPLVVRSFSLSNAAA